MYKLIDGKMIIDKDPDAVLPYGIDLVDWLDGDTVTDVTTTAVGVTAENPQVSGTEITANISGGVVGEEAYVTFHFSGAGWNDDRTIYFNIIPR